MVADVWKMCIKKFDAEIFLSNLQGFQLSAGGRYQVSLTYYQVSFPVTLPGVYVAWQSSSVLQLLAKQGGVYCFN